jgi:hypothetical protein
MTAQINVEQLYTQYIKALPAEDRLRLLAVIARDLVPVGSTSEPHERSLLELEGLGAEIWQGIDAQQYVDELRAEWTFRRLY